MTRQDLLVPVHKKSSLTCPVTGGPLELYLRERKNCHYSELTPHLGTSWLPPPRTSMWVYLVSTPDSIMESFRFDHRKAL